VRTARLFLNFNYIDIDTVSFDASGGVQIYGFGGAWFAMDNFKLNEVQATPEPAVMLLLGLGLAALAGAGRKFKK